MSAEPVTVLIVDDQDPFRNVARAVVNATPGFDVVADAATGEDAVTTATATSPDVVLMDINLPGINGMEATRQILAGRPSTIVILLSTYAKSDLPANALDCGAVSYVHKEDFGPWVLQDTWDGHAPSRT
jgi:DNA-binding NarL/FixJ family response regulator